MVEEIQSQMSWPQRLRTSPPPQAASALQITPHKRNAGHRNCRRKGHKKIRLYNCEALYAYRESDSSTVKETQVDHREWKKKWEKKKKTLNNKNNLCWKTENEINFKSIFLLQPGKWDRISGKYRGKAIRHTWLIKSRKFKYYDEEQKNKKCYNKAKTPK